MLQRLSSLPGSIYWLANMLWDYCFTYVTYLIMLTPMVLIWGYGDNLQFWASVALLFLSYGWAAIPVAYLISMGFTKPARAFAVAVTLKSALGWCEKSTPTPRIRNVYTSYWLSQPAGWR